MKVSKALASVLVLSVLASAGARASSIEFKDYIIGGTLVEPSDPVASSTVLIMGQGVSLAGRQFSYICSGSVIASDIVLTAAHCVAENPSHPAAVSQLHVVYSTHFPKSPNDPSVRSVSGYRVHPGWTGNIQQPDAHDIAVLRIVGDMPVGYAPAELLARDARLYSGQEVLLAGFGVTSGTDQVGQSAGILREVPVNVIQEYGQTEVLVDASHSQGPCGGDSGGPAFVAKSGHFYLWGVTSRGDATCSEVGVYTKISPYFNFIGQSIRSLRRSKSG